MAAKLLKIRMYILTHSPFHGLSQQLILASPVYLVSMVLFRLASCNIKNWAALGDSFASGIGAGDRENLNPGDRTCSRYTQA